MSTAESLKKLLDEFNEKENMISEERSAVEGQIAELEQRLEECNKRMGVVAEDRAKVLAFKDRYGSDHGSNGGGGAALGLLKKPEKDNAAEHTSPAETSEAAAKAVEASSPPHIEPVKPDRRGIFANSRLNKQNQEKPAEEPKPKAEEASPPRTIEPPTVSVPERTHGASAEAKAETPPAASVIPEPAAPPADVPAPAPLPEPPQAPPVPVEPAPVAEAPPPSPPPPMPKPEVPAWLSQPPGAQTAEVSRPEPQSGGMSAVERFSAQFAKDAVSGPGSAWNANMNAEMPVPQVDQPAAAPVAPAAPTPPPAPSMPAGGINSLLADLSSDEPAPASNTGEMARGGINSILRRSGTTGEMPVTEAAATQQAVFGDSGGPAPMPAGSETPGAAAIFGTPLGGTPGLGTPPQPTPPQPTPPQPVAPQPVAPQPVAPPSPWDSAPAGGPPQPTGPQGPPQPTGPQGPPQPRGPQAPAAPPTNNTGGWTPPTAPAADAPAQAQAAQPAQPATVDLNAQEGPKEEDDGDTVKNINDALRSLFR